MKILIIGANGQLGSELVQILSSHDLTKYTLEEFDFSSEEPFVLDDSYDFVLNAMAMTNTGACEDEPEIAYKLNAIRVGEMAKQCQLKNTTFVHFSTDYVFDGNSYSAYTEESAVAPLSRYGVTKLAGEYEALMYCQKTFVFRIASLYGINGNNFVKTMLEKAKKGEPLKVVNDQVMSPTHAKDVARVVKSFLESDNTNYGVYHCSNEGKCSWYEFAKEFLSYAKIEVPVEAVSWKDFPAKLRRPIDSHMSVEKLKKYYPMPDWQSSLKEFIQIWERNK